MTPDQMMWNQEKDDIEAQYQKYLEEIIVLYCYII